MTESQAQEYLHILYEGDNSTPSSSDNEYLMRRSLLNAAIGIWEKEELWNELYVSLSDAADGDKTTVADQSSYDCPSDFKFPLGFLWIGTTDYELMPSQDYTLISSTDTSSYFYYVTGNKSAGYKIHIHPAPSSSGDDIRYEYYKEASTLSDTTDVFEMSDPWFAIYYALSKLFKNDGKITDSREALMEAASRLERMKEINAMPGFYQSNRIKDSQFSRSVGGFGK